MHGLSISERPICLILIRIGNVIYYNITNISVFWPETANA